jgi:possible RNA polymerase sigma factor
MLQEELWSIRLAVSSSLQPTTSHQLWGTLYSQIEQRLLTGVGIAFPHIGVFTTQQEREFIALLPDGRYFLIPPRLSLMIYPTPSMPGGERSLSLIFLREALSHTTKLKIEYIDKWIDCIPHLWLDLLEAGGSVTWPRIGVFEAIRSEDSTELVGYAFTPHQSFAESLNKPFCMFSPIEIPAERIQQGLEIRRVEGLEEARITRPIKIRLPREDHELIPTSPLDSPVPEPQVAPAPTPTEDRTEHHTTGSTEAKSEATAEVCPQPERAEATPPHMEDAHTPGEVIPTPEEATPIPPTEDSTAPQPPLIQSPEVGCPTPSPEVESGSTPTPTQEAEATVGGAAEEGLPTFEISTATRTHEMQPVAKPEEPETFEIIPNRSPQEEDAKEAELPIFTIAPTVEPSEGGEEPHGSEPETFDIAPVAEPSEEHNEKPHGSEPETFDIAPVAEPSEERNEKPQEETPTEPLPAPSPEPIEERVTEPIESPTLPPTPPTPIVPNTPEVESQPTPPPSDPRPTARRRTNYYIWIAVVALLIIGAVLAVFILNSRQKKASATPRPAAKDTQQMASVVVVPSSMDILPDSLTLPADTLQEEPIDTLPERTPQEEPKAQSKERVINSETTRVQVQPGDRLTVFALKKYGHKAFWVYIYQENKSKIKDPNNLPVGITIVLPPAKKYEINPRDTNSINKALELQHSLRKE